MSKPWTASIIMARLSKGYDFDDFISEYGLIDQADLEIQLQKVTRQNSQLQKTWLRKMKKNCKKKNRISSCKDKNPEADEKKDETVKTAETAELLEADETVAESVEHHENAGRSYEQIKNDRKELLYALQKKQNEAVEYCIALEQERKKFLNIYHDDNQKLNAISQEIAEIEAKVKELRGKAAEFVERIQKAPQKLIEHNQLIEMANAERKSIEGEIQNLMYLSILCDVNPNEETNYDYCMDDIEVDNSMVSEKMTEFFKTDVCEIMDDLSVKQLRELAKIIIVAELVEKDTRNKVDLLFNQSSALTEVLEVMGKTVIICTNK